MARPLRFEYPGAVYHLTACGDGGKTIFTDRDDHALFLRRLGELCGSHGWRIHAWVLIPNHFHLLAETPEPNLVSGMKWLLGAFSQGWNRRHQRRGHVFQGRYKSVPVAGERAGNDPHFKMVADYIHLNPARAGLAGGRSGPLADFEWSSLACYLSGEGPAYLARARVLAAHQLADDEHGRHAYIQSLEAQAAAGGTLAPDAMAALRRGWFLGDDSFRDQLLALLRKGSPTPSGNSASPSGTAVTAHGLPEAQRLVVTGLTQLGLSGSGDSLTQLAKGDPRKVALATRVKTRTNAGNQWLSDRLHMGHDRSVSRLIHLGRSKDEVAKFLKLLAASDGAVSDAENQDNKGLSGTTIQASRSAGTISVGTTDLRIMPSATLPNSSETTTPCPCEPSTTRSPSTFFT